MSSHATAGAAVVAYLEAYIADDGDALRAVIPVEEHWLLEGPTVAAPRDTHAVSARIRAMIPRTATLESAALELVLEGGGERRRRHLFMDVELSADGGWLVRPSTTRSRLDGGDRPIGRLVKRMEG